MHPFVYARATSAQGAVETHHLAQTPPDAASVRARSQYLAGGTTLVDLMRSLSAAAGCSAGCQGSRGSS